MRSHRLGVLPRETLGLRGLTRILLASSMQEPDRLGSHESAAQGALRTRRLEDGPSLALGALRDGIQAIRRAVRRLILMGPDSGGGDLKDDPVPHGGLGRLLVRPADREAVRAGYPWIGGQLVLESALDYPEFPCREVELTRLHGRLVL